eukprot:531038-Hanusia_phi.AAC.1
MHFPLSAEFQTSVEGLRRDAMVREERRGSVSFGEVKPASLCCDVGHVSMWKHIFTCTFGEEMEEHVD